MTNKEAITHLECLNSEVYSYLTEGQYKALKMAIKALENEPKQAKWIKVDPESRGYAEIYQCSNCLTNVQLSYWDKECDYGYCPNCGADMRGDDNDN